MATKKSKEQLHWIDIEELAANICGIDAEDSDVEEALYEKYEISSVTYHAIVQDLFDRLDFSISPLTRTAFIGFADKRFWLIKKEVNQQFIAGVIEWLTESKLITGDIHGFSTIITKSGKPEYEITIKLAKPTEGEEKEEK